MVNGTTVCVQLTPGMVLFLIKTCLAKIVEYARSLTLADLGGRARRAPPPQGSQFFRFDIQNFRNVTASGVHTPSYEVHAPPTGNPGSATDWYIIALTVKETTVDPGNAQLILPPSVAFLSNYCCIRYSNLAVVRYCVVSIVLSHLQCYPNLYINWCVLLLV